MKKLKFAKEKKVSISKLKKKAWEQFSLWIRLKDYIDDYKAICVTCGKVLPYKQMQAGHFIPGKHNSVLFDERNVHVQCYTCNVILGGNGPKYYEFMLREYDQKTIDELERLDRINKQYKPFELEAIYDIYKRKVNEIVS